MEVFFHLQIAVNLFFQQLGDVFLVISRFFSFLGDENFYFLFMPILYWCVNTAMGMRIGAILLISNSVIGGLKMLFHWPRPFWIDDNVVNFVDERSFGFPSGHSGNAASVWGVFAAQFKKRWIWWLVIFTVLMIGISRLAMGVHFLVDVLGGWTVGILLALLFVKYEKPVSRWFNRLQLRQQYLVAIVTSLFVILPEFLFSWMYGNITFPEAWAINAGSPLDPFNPSGAFTAGGTWAGFLCGFAWFRKKFGALPMNVSLSTRILRFSAGILGVLVFWRGLDMVFPDSNSILGLSLRYVRYFLTGFWISGLGPWLFRKIIDPIGAQKISKVAPTIELPDAIQPEQTSPDTLTQPHNTLQ